MLIHDLTVLYHRNRLSRKPSATYYARMFRQVFPPIDTFDAQTVPKIVLIEWLGNLLDRPSHARKAFGALRAAYRWAIGAELLTRDATLGIQKPRDQTRAVTTSPDEWARVAPILEDLPLRRRVFFWGLYLMGPRPGELRKAQTELVFLDREPPAWVKRVTKNGQPHITPLADEYVPLLRLVIRTNPPGTKYLFWGARPSVPWSRSAMQRMWEGIREKAGLTHLWPNDLRRSTASDLLNAGHNLGVVKDQLGHASLSQTAKYAYLAIQPLDVALQQRANTIIRALY